MTNFNPQVHGPRTGSHQWRKLRAQVLAASDVCGECGQPGATQVDHIRNVSRGGTDDPSNLQPVHASCHAAKSAREAAAARPRIRRPRQRHPGIIDPDDAA